MALALHAFVVIVRVSDGFPSLRLALVTGSLAALLALIGSKAGRPKLLSIPEWRAVLALLALTAVTIPFSVWPGNSFAFVTGAYLKVVLLFGLIVYGVASIRAVKVVIWAVLVAMMSLEIGLLAWGTGDRPHVTSTYDSNDIALVMVSGFPLAALWFLNKRGPSRYLAALISALAVVTIVRTGSRAGLLGFLIVLGLIVLRMPPRHRVVGALVGLACVLVIGTFGSQTYWERMATIWGGSNSETRSLDDYDVTGLWGARWGVWQTALQLIFTNAVIGVGAGGYETAEGLSHGGAGKWSAAHNSFLQIGAELGLAGLGLFIFLIYRAVKNCRGVIRFTQHEPRPPDTAWLARSVELSLYGYVVVGFTLSQAYSHLLYILIAISVVLARLASEHPGLPERYGELRRATARIP